MRISNKELADILRSVAAAYILTNVNRFRIIAYEKAADTVEHMNQEVYDAWENRGLEGIRGLQGIGPTISQHLDEYFAKSGGSFLQQQLESIPAPVYELMKAPGIGPKKAFRIVQEFNLTNRETAFEDVLQLAKKHKISVLEGFGEKSEQDIVSAIHTQLNRRDKEERMALPEAFGLAQNVMTYMRQLREVDHIEALGSLRRMVATIGDIDLAAIAKPEDNKKILNYFVNYPQQASIEAEGVDKGAIITKNGKRIDLRIIDKDRYGAMLQYFTGSKAHNIKLREYALKKGLSLNEFGIKNVKSGVVKNFSDEKDFYNYLRLDHIPPEMREGNDEVKLAARHKLPDLIVEADIKGDFHLHSSFPIEPSHDLGANSFEEIIEKALARNYSYIAFSEHNPSVAKHTTAEMTALVKQKREAINAVQKKYSAIKLYNSMEIDILPTGALAMPDEAIDILDFAIVSIHSAFTQDRATMTTRILKAFTHPKVKIFGHPTARLINKREGIDADWGVIFAEAAKKNIAMEVNSHPDRLDLPDDMIRQAIASGCQIVLDTDSHAVEQLDNMFFGVAVARRGWATKQDVINALPSSKIEAWIHQ